MNFCPKCGVQITPNDSFCRGCGSQIQTNNAATNNVGVQQTVANNPVVQPTQTVVQPTVQNNQNYNDDELIRAYIGPNADKIMNLKGGSIWAFLIEDFYFIYRKMYLVGFIWLICSCLIPRGIGKCISLIMAFLFKPIYLNHVKNKVNKIKSESPNKNFEELKSICSKKGGTNALVVALAIAGVVIFLQIMGYDDYLLRQEAKENNEQNEKENIVAINLVDPSTETFTSCPTSIDNSKYLKKQEITQQTSSNKNIIATPMVTVPGMENWPTVQYTANLTLENVDAAFAEKALCFTEYNIQNAHYDITYNITATVGDSNLSFYAKGNDSAYLPSVYIGNDMIPNPNFYIFNDEYLVVVSPTTATTGPRIDDEIYIYDKTGTKVFESTGLTLDVYDQNGNIKNSGIKYTKICSGAWYYEDCENITSGEIKYDTINKKFVVEEATIKYVNQDL